MCGVVRRLRQRAKVRLLFKEEIEWLALSLLMDPKISGVGQPVGGRLVEVLKRGEGAAVEEVFFGIVKWSFDFSFRKGCQLHII